MIVDVLANHPQPQMSGNLDILSSLKCHIVRAQRAKTSEGSEGSVGAGSPTRKTWGFSGKQVCDPMIVGRAFSLARS